MSQVSIPVDFLNPGQVFACLGFLEAAEVLLGDAEGGFTWSDDDRFVLRASGVANPFAVVIEFLKSAEPIWVSPDPHIQERDGGNTTVRHGISASVEPRPADLAGELRGTFSGEEHAVPFGYWADGSSRFKTTFKKSTNGASCHVRMRNALEGMRNLEPEASVAEPFAQSALTESLFRLDPRGSVDPINAGFSPDKLRKGGIHMRVATYPICEVLAVVGLEHARPSRDGPRRLHYNVWAAMESHSGKGLTLMPAVLARVAVAESLPFVRTRRFLVDHQEVKRGGDRKIIQAIEETSI